MRVEMIPRFRRRLSILSIVKKLVAADYRPRRPVRCLGMTSDHRQPRCVLGERTDDGTSGTGGTVSSVMSLTSRCVTGNDGRARVRRKQGEKPINACIYSMNGNCCRSVVVWVPSTMVGTSELSTTNVTSRLSAIVCFPGRRTFLDNALPHTACNTTDFLAQQAMEVTDWTDRNSHINT